MENLKKLMGDAYHEGITTEEINNFLSGKNLADLSSGKYVDKDKYNSLKKDYDSLKNDTKDYESLRTENEQLKTEKTQSLHFAKIKEAGVDDKFAKFVYSELDKGDKFEENLKAYLKDNPHYMSERKPRIINSNPNLNDGTDKAKSENAIMNNIFRGKTE